VQPATTSTVPIPAFLNPEAGSAPAALRALEADPRFTIHPVEGGELARAVAAAVAGGARRILVAGGDGTLATAAARLVSTTTELAVLPAGTLNHFARSLGIPDVPAEALETAAAGRVRRVDAGRVNEELFLNTSSVGAYVDLVRRRERLERHLGYRLAGALAAAGLLLRLPLSTLDLEVRGERHRYRTPLLFVGVGERDLTLPAFGERTGDGGGTLHAIVVRSRGRARLLALALDAVRRGVRRVARTPHLDSFLVAGCTVDLPRGRAHVALDGEVRVLRSPLRYRIEGSALAVVVPADR
jgi:diacylglycerol kinase family enzyme